VSLAAPRTIRLDPPPPPSATRSGCCDPHQLRHCLRLSLCESRTSPVLADDGVGIGAKDKGTAFDRCKYGTLNVLCSPEGVRAAHAYGECYLELDPSVRARCTLAPCDTGGISRPSERLAVPDYYAHVIMEFSDLELDQSLGVAYRTPEWRDSRVLRTYKEAQIHGPIELSRRDVLRLVAPDTLERETLSKLAAFAKSKGVGFKTYRKPEPPSDAFDFGIPRPATPRAGFDTPRPESMPHPGVGTPPPLSPGPTWPEYMRPYAEMLAATTSRFSSLDNYFSGARIASSLAEAAWGHGWRRVAHIDHLLAQQLLAYVCPRMFVLYYPYVPAPWHDVDGSVLATFALLTREGGCSDVVANLIWSTLVKLFPHSAFPSHAYTEVETSMHRLLAVIRMVEDGLKAEHMDSAARGGRFFGI
jgi:hypothetical protein